MVPKANRSSSTRYSASPLNLAKMRMMKARKNKDHKSYNGYKSGLVYDGSFTGFFEYCSVAIKASVESQGSTSQT